MKNRHKPVPIASNFQRNIRGSILRGTGRPEVRRQKGPTIFGHRSSPCKAVVIRIKRTLPSPPEYRRFRTSFVVNRLAESLDTGALFIRPFCFSFFFSRPTKRQSSLSNFGVIRADRIFLREMVKRPEPSFCFLRISRIQKRNHIRPIARLIDRR